MLGKPGYHSITLWRVLPYPAFEQLEPDDTFFFQTGHNSQKFRNQVGTKKEKVNFTLLTSYGVKAEGQSLHRHVGEKCENCFETGEFGQV